jgi:hypothetical protein
VRRVLLHDIYRHFDFKERIQNRYLRNLMDVFWSRLESPDLRVAALLRGVSTASRRQHLKIYSREANEQAVLADLGVSGDYATSGSAIQMVFHNNLAANKVDFFLHRTIQTTVDLRLDGSADVEVEIDLRNDAPTEEGSVLVRPLRDDLPSGTNEMSLYVLMPRGSQATEMSVDGRDASVLTGTEGGYPLAWQLLDIGPQETGIVRMSYRWTRAMSADGSFELTLFPQATARPDSYDLMVTAPPGYAFRASEGGTKGAVTVAGKLREPLTMTLRVIPSEQDSR